MQPPMISLQDQTGWISLCKSDTEEAKQKRSTANDHHSRKGELKRPQRLLGKVRDKEEYSKRCRVDSPVVGPQQNLHLGMEQRNCRVDSPVVAHSRISSFALQQVQHGEKGRSTTGC